MATIPDTLDALRAKLASLQAQAVDARAELARLRVDLAHARMQLDGDAIHRLLVANEQLVMDAMRSRDMVESTALLMSELSRCSELDSLTQLPIVEAARAGDAERVAALLEVHILDTKKELMASARSGAIGSLNQASSPAADALMAAPLICRGG